MFCVDIELDKMIGQAQAEGVSDIHFDATDRGLAVRCRIDGLLQPRDEVPQPYADQFINRIKVLSGLDISEKRIPQDGRWQWTAGDSPLSMRVSTMPTSKGETVVCRLLGTAGHQMSLEELGMDEALIASVKELLRRPYGLLLITGPTGSGKTATLYALIRQLNCEEETVISLENPVELELPKVIQVEIQEKAGLSFARALRAVLRQDPDSIVIGEIRDQETAALAVQAALTGHRVLATLHTNRATAVIERLRDMGVEEYLVKATVTAALAQRLIRTVDGPVDSGNGAKYKGRTALYELMYLPQDREAVDWDNLHTYVTQSLEEGAYRLWTLGKTTEEELRRTGLHWQQALGAATMRTSEQLSPFYGQKEEVLSP